MTGLIVQLGLVAAGGAAGSCLRYLLGQAVGVTGFPIATLLVNVLGSAAMGALVGVAAHWDGFNAHLRPLLMVGLLGGFTTFSSFSLDAVALWERGEIFAAAGYVAASVLGAIGAFVLAMLAVRGAYGG